MPMIGVALTLIFAGGAAGKLVCGWLGARLGVVHGDLSDRGADRSCASSSCSRYR